MGKKQLPWSSIARKTIKHWCTGLAFAQGTSSHNHIPSMNCKGHIQRVSLEIPTGLLLVLIPKTQKKHISPNEAITPISGSSLILLWPPVLDSLTHSFIFLKNHGPGSEPLFWFSEIRRSRVHILDTYPPVLSLEKEREIHHSELATVLARGRKNSPFIEFIHHPKIWVLLNPKNLNSN